MDAKGHVPDEDLAGLAAGISAESRGNEIRDHLAGCRQCYAAYAEAVRCRARELAEPGAFSASVEMIRLGKAVASPARNERIAGKRSARGRTFAGALGGIAVIALAVLFWPSGDVGEGPAPLDAATSAALQAAVARTSSRGMILPGGKSLAGAVASTYRSADTPDSQALSSAISHLELRARQGDQSRETAYWLGLGRLLVGDLRAARDGLDASRERFPEDQCLAVLGAALAYRECDLDRAEALLRMILAADTANAVANFNLGFLLEEQGRTADARPLLRSARDQAPGSDLAERAAGILRRLE